jgi:hypothetical protein
MRPIIVLGLLALVACGTSSCTNANAQAQAALASQRYVIVHSPHAQRYTQLLDTATGRTWTLVNRGEGSPTSFAWEDTPKVSDLTR